MKKVLLGLVVVAASGASCAQSSASVSGYVQFQYLNDMGGAAKGIGVAFATVTVSGSEDLGGGLKAAYSSEIGLGEARDQRLSKRDTSLALSGDFGALTIANTQSSSLLVTQAMVGTNNNGWYGPYDYSESIVKRSPVDSLSFSKEVGPVNITAEYAESQDDGNTSPATKTASLGIAYSAGALTVAARVKSGQNATWAGARNKRAFEVGGSYDFGVAKVGVALDTKRVGESTSEKEGVAFGIAVPVGSVVLGLGTIKRGDAQFTEARVNYALSKRSDIEFNYGKVKDTSHYSQVVISHAF